MLKNTARHMFHEHRMDLSVSSMKAIEAQVLAFAKAEVKPLVAILYV